MEDGFELDPLSTYASLRERFPGESFLLESVEGTKKTARYSFIGVDPVHVFKSRGGTIQSDGQSFKVPDPF
ncbi:MAG: anthranilate synthase component I, partial [Thermoplasmata archaeon]|nr:anthranilate synthase component I [Thermoplasmata archaeon]